MTVCEMCGKSGELFVARVEGTELNVCSTCGKFGKRVRKRVLPVQRKPVLKEPEVVEVVVGDFARKVRSARQKLGKTQKEFAQMLNERESIVQKMESGSFTPTLKTAKKLQRVLKVALVEVESEEKASVQGKRSGPLTIGDIIKIKK